MSSPDSTVASEGSAGCPGVESLLGLLADALGPVERVAVEDHVETCPACQGRLGGLASGPTEERFGLGTGADTLVDTRADRSAEERLAERLKRETPPEFRANPPPWRRDSFTTRVSLAEGSGSLTAGAIGRREADRERLRRILIEVLGGDSGPYEVQEELGRGGMGVVFKARDLRLGRLVAIKMMRGGAGEVADWSRFRREAHAVARLQHPNIIQLFDVGADRRAPYLIMEYVGGPTLADRPQGAVMDPIEASGLIESLARAIHHAHQQGIVHRDLKPSNVLFDASGTAKIADFGLAKLMDPVEGVTEESGTRRGTLLGTPHYMSPEQARGESRSAGPAADVYALGTIFYELLVGETVFSGASSAEVLRQVRESEPVAPRSHRPDLSAELEAICLSCLAKDPALRPATAWELAESLRRHRLVGGRGGGTLRPGELRAPTHRPHPRLVVATTVALVLGMVAGSVVSGYLLGSRHYPGTDGVATGPAPATEDSGRAAARSWLDGLVPLDPAIWPFLDPEDRPATFVAPPAAPESWAKALGSFAKVAGETDAPEDLVRLARGWDALGRSAEAGTAWDAALGAIRRAPEDRRPDLASLALERVRWMEGERSLAESEAAAREALEWIGPAPRGRPAVDRAVALGVLAGLSERAGRDAEARDWSGQAAEAIAEDDREPEARLVAGWARLALSRQLARAEDKGAPSAAARTARADAVRILEVWGREHPGRTEAARGLAAAASELGEWELNRGPEGVVEAARQFERAWTFLTRGDADARAMARGEERRARAAASGGRPEAAASALERAARWVSAARGPGPALPEDVDDRWHASDSRSTLPPRVRTALAELLESAARWDRPGFRTVRADRARNWTKSPPGSP